MLGSYYRSLTKILSCNYKMPSPVFETRSELQFHDELCQKVDFKIDRLLEKIEGDKYASDIEKKHYQNQLRIFRDRMYADGVYFYLFYEAEKIYKAFKRSKLRRIRKKVSDVVHCFDLL